MPTSSVLDHYIATLSNLTDPRHLILVLPQRHRTSDRSGYGHRLVSTSHRPQWKPSQWYVELDVNYQRVLMKADLEIYTVRTDALGLITLAGLLLCLSDVVPLPLSLFGPAFTVPASEKARRPYGRVLVVWTMFHHLTTCIGSFSHWIKPSHRTVA